ncbi:hypothetical protein F3Y22_tig00110610pilonHSYRG00581 [Hibiscus syriacus]|uniref:Cytochrome P450 n=1 Tax=Hibiscus syriacus TaxID=106335 RepID=A0A6A3A1D0_HIBSY|nr:hypothetical protein F3Y22_tig00110610pilonHSYRG00581 [Hibiscus syriacus]
MCRHFWDGLDIGGDKESMKKIAKELDQVMEGWLQEHKRKIDEDEANSEQDLMGVLLAILRDAMEHDTDTINKANTLALLLAAEDTTSITMTWALSLLLNNRDALHKVQHELNIHVEHLGFESRRISHMKSVVRSKVKTELQQHLQHPPSESDMFSGD